MTCSLFVTNTSEHEDWLPRSSNQRVDGLWRQKYRSVVVGFVRGISETHVGKIYVYKWPFNGCWTKGKKEAKGPFSSLLLLRLYYLKNDTSLSNTVG